MENKIKILSEEFFKNFWINYDSIEISKKQENIFIIKIKTSESWKLIWPQWKNLDSLSSILKLIILKNLENSENIKIFLEINDYLKTKDERLKDFVLNKIKILDKNWEDIIFPYFSPYERKKIHDIVADLNRPEIFTKSIWEWKERRLHLCKLEKKLSIDIDSLDI